MKPVKRDIYLVITVILAAAILFRAPVLASDAAEPAHRAAEAADKVVEKEAGPSPVLVIAGPAVGPAEKPPSPALPTDPPPASTQADATTDTEERLESETEGGPEQPGPTEEQSPAEGQETPDDPGEAGTEVTKPDTLIWAADDCGCTPIQPDRAAGTAKITYGFYHRAMAADEETGTAKIKYSRLNRIGFYALDWNGEDGPVISRYWENNTLVKNARRYNSRVDLVVVFPEDPADPLGHPSRTDHLLREIRRWIKDFDSTGVTLDLEKSGLPGGEPIYRFVGELSRTLAALGKGRYLNLFLSFEQMESDRALTEILDRMHGMRNMIDLFLVRIRPSPRAEDGKVRKNEFLTLSDTLDEYDLTHFDPKADGTGLKPKVIPVLEGGGEENEAVFSQILSVGFGGVGLWPETALSNDATQFIADVFHRHQDQLPLDPVKRIVFDHFPGLCKTVCPNRTLITRMTAGFGALLFLYFLLSFFICRLRALARAYPLYFVGAILVFMALTASLILCVPKLQGWRTEALLLLLACGAAYTSAGYVKRRRAARYP